LGVLELAVCAARKMTDQGKVVVLVTSITSNPLAEVAQRNLLTALSGKKISVEEVDGALVRMYQRISLDC